MSSFRLRQVVHLIPTLFGKDGIIGGAERYALELARHMAEVVPTRLISFGQTAQIRQFGLLTTRILPTTWQVRGQQTNPVTGLPLWRELAKADVVHCHQQHVLVSSLTALFCRLTGRRVFVSDLGGGGWDISHYLSTDNWYQSHLHISQYSRQIYGQTSNSRAHVIYGGVDTNKFSPDNSLSRQPFVLFVGRILPHKGVNYLIEALPPGLQLRIIGQPYDPQFLRDLQQLATGKSVEFLHECTDLDLVNNYRQALAIVLPSVYKTMYQQETKVPELLGQTLLEGMSCAAPAICTNVASMPEIVINNVTGFIVPPNDPAALREKLCYLRDNPQEVVRLGQAARQRVLSHFTWSQVVKRCLEIYTK
jgi:glycosyltransferase involved in cell wall biosynthesis